jgi:uncharacterized lipoprotein
LREVRSIKRLLVVVAALAVTLTGCSGAATYEEEEAVLRRIAAESTFMSAPDGATIGDAYVWPKCTGEGSGNEGFVSAGVSIRNPSEAESAAAMLDHYHATAVADGWEVVESEATRGIDGAISKSVPS